MTEEEEQEMIETVLERTGIECDIPALNDVWPLIEDRQEQFDVIFVSLITQTAKYLQPMDDPTELLGRCPVCGFYACDCRDTEA